MPKYYFDLKLDAEDPARDEEGSHQPDLAAARLEAANSILDIIKELADDVTNPIIVEVRDDNGIVFRATLSFEMTRIH